MFSLDSCVSLELNCTAHIDDVSCAILNFLSTTDSKFSRAPGGAMALGQDMQMLKAKPSPPTLKCKSTH